MGVLCLLTEPPGHEQQGQGLACLLAGLPTSGGRRGPSSPTLFLGDAGQDEGARFLLHEGPGANGQLPQVRPRGAHVPAHPQVSTHCGHSEHPSLVGAAPGPCCCSLRRWKRLACPLGGEPTQAHKSPPTRRMPFPERPGLDRCPPPGQSRTGGRVGTQSRGGEGRARRPGAGRARRAAGVAPAHLPPPPQRRPQQVHLRLPLLRRPKPGPAGAAEALRGQPPQRPQPRGEWPGRAPGAGPPRERCLSRALRSRCAPSARRCPGGTPATRAPTSCSTCYTGTSSPTTPLW